MASAVILALITAAKEFLNMVRLTSLSIIDNSNLVIINEKENYSGIIALLSKLP